MGKVLVKPDGKIETADGPRYVTKVDGVELRGDRPMTIEQRDGAQKIIRTVRRKFDAGEYGPG